MGIPYIIVKGKFPLGNVVRKKTAAVVAVQEVKSENQRELATLVSAAKANLCVVVIVSFLRVADGVWWDSSDKDERRRV